MAGIQYVRPRGAQLPPELWVEVLAFLPHRDLARALCTSRTFQGIKDEAYRASCYRRWPSLAAIAENPDAQWATVYDLLAVREREPRVLADVQALLKRQTVVSEQHRAILTEWLCEVSFEWSLDSVVVFEAVKYLDHYLSQAVVESLGSFQLVGLGCLRLAMADAACAPRANWTREDALDPKHFAHISDDTYTSEQVEKFTKILDDIIPAEFGTVPNAKMHLRSLWARATAAGLVNDAADIHAYSLASFLLNLSLLSLRFSAVPPSQMAAAALALALTGCRRDPWPAPLQRLSAYALEDLMPTVMDMALAQAEQAAPQLRSCWSRAYAPAEEGAAPTSEWKHVLSLFAAPSPALIRALEALGESPRAVDVAAALTDGVEVHKVPPPSSREESPSLGPLPTPDPYASAPSEEETPTSVQQPQQPRAAVRVGARAF